MARRPFLHHIDPDEVFLDSSNLPALDQNQFEGRIEAPISRLTIGLVSTFFLLVGLIFVSRIGILQLVHGGEYLTRSKNNTLHYRPILADRGIIYDRRGTELAWNNPTRTYITDPGFSHLLGYIGVPTETTGSSTQKYEENEYVGRDGLEASEDARLAGEKGLRIEEVNAVGEITSDHNVKEPKSGSTLTLSVDARIQTKLYQTIASVAQDRGFWGGAGIMIDVKTGELIAITSYPEYDPNVMTARTDKKTISGYFTNVGHPFLDRAISGLYAPGSIFKPIVAIGALTEKTISPEKKILSTGQLVVPNPYDAKLNSVFKDWKAHGWVNMREAIAVSSDVYFYEVGGGFGDQKGLGIAKIDQYAKLFGLSTTTDIDLPGEAFGTIPTPEWKAKNFDNEPWRLGDTYHTAIGQYGVLVTPIQMARVVAAIANNGFLLKPSLFKITAPATGTGQQLPIPADYFQIVREGMRLGVQIGTGKGLDTAAVKIGSKTGTAELGVSKANVNSWVMGFFPYDHPRYAFAVVMEHGHKENTIGGVFVMRTLIDWMAANTPEYFN